KLQDIPPQVLVLDNRLEPLTNLVRIDTDRFRAALGQLEQHVIEQGREHRVQPPRTDVLHPMVYVRCDARDLADAILGELELGVLRRDQRLVLSDQRVLRLRQDAHEVGLRKRLQLDPDREATLQLRNQVTRLGDVERAGGDEQHVVGAHHAVLCRYGRALDDRQQVALHALARDVGTLPRALARDLVDLVEEDDAHVLGPLERLVHDLVHVDQLVQLVLQEDAARLGDADRAALLPLRHHLLQHLRDVVHPLRAHREHHVLDGQVLLDLDVDHPLLELPVTQQRAQLLACALAPLPDAPALVLVRHLLFTRLRIRADDECARALRRLATVIEAVVVGLRQQQVQQPLLDALLRDLLDLRLALVAHHVDGHVHEVADHRLDVAADVADLRELRGFNLHERRTGQAREPTRDLGLADTGRADQDDVVRYDLVTQLVVDPLPAPPVAQCDCNRALRRILPDDVLVQLRDDLLRRQLVQPRRIARRSAIRRLSVRYVHVLHDPFTSPAPSPSSRTRIFLFV